MPSGRPSIDPAMTLIDPSDQELEVLENIYSHQDHVRQRDVARIAGLSLGMTNAIVKRLVQKGWLTIRKVNNRNIRYAVSPAGVEQISRRSYRYLKRTIRNIVYYREAIEAFVRDVKGGGFEAIALVGRSDLDFIVDHACSRYGLRFVHDHSGDGARGLFVLYSEDHEPSSRGGERSAVPAAVEPRSAGAAAPAAAYLGEVLRQSAQADGW